MNIILAFAFYLIAIFAGWLNWKWLSLPFRLALLHVFISFVEESIGSYISHYLRLYNIWLYNLIFLFEIWLIGCIVLCFLKDMRKLIIILLSLMSLVWFYQAPKYFFTGLMNYSWILVGLFVACFFSIILFRASTKNQSFFKIPEVWLCIGYLVFWIGNIPFTGFYNSEFLRSFGSSMIFIPVILTVTYSLCVAISFVLQGKKKEETYFSKR